MHVPGCADRAPEPGRALRIRQSRGSSHDSVNDADFEQMQRNDWTYLIQGTLSQSGGKSCPPKSLAAPPTGRAPNGSNAGGDDCYDNPRVAFDLGASAVTHFGPCELDGIPGVSVSSGSTQTVTATIHGDHIVFNGFPEGAEGGGASSTMARGLRSQSRRIGNAPGASGHPALRLVGDRCSLSAGRFAHHAAPLDVGLLPGSARDTGAHERRRGVPLQRHLGLAPQGSESRICPMSSGFLTCL
jgi:hypothetical protein